MPFCKSSWPPTRKARASQNPWPTLSDTKASGYRSWETSRAPSPSTGNRLLSARRLWLGTLLITPHWWRLYAVSGGWLRRWLSRAIVPARWKWPKKRSRVRRSFLELTAGRSPTTSLGPITVWQRSKPPLGNGATREPLLSVRLPDISKCLPPEMATCIRKTWPAPRPCSRTASPIHDRKFLFFLQNFPPLFALPSERPKYGLYSLFGYGCAAGLSSNHRDLSGMRP